MAQFDSCNAGSSGQMQEPSRLTLAKGASYASALAALCVTLATALNAQKRDDANIVLRRALAPERSGCTAEQVSDRDPRVGSCYRQQENDVRRKLPSTHYVFCTPTGRSCCAVDNAGGAASDCTVIDRSVKPHPAATLRQPGRR